MQCIAGAGRLVAVVSVLLVGQSCLAGDIYSWTDDQGLRHYSNVSPSPSAAGVEQFQEDRSMYEGFSRETREKIVFTARKIYDGDSLKVAGAGLTLMVRLVGIDAPETGGGKHPPQPYSARAKAAFSRMISNRPFTLKSHGTGGYNRVLAEVFAGGKNVNLELIRQGFAEVYRGRMPASLDRSAYLAAQEEARARGRGIWSLGKTYESPRQWRRNHPRK